MRKVTLPRKSDGLTVKAYAGTTAVMMCFDLFEEKRNGLLGFAISRISPDHPDKTKRGKRWLKAELRFPNSPKQTGGYETSVCPVQKFRWSDYTVYPGNRYTYAVHPVYGTWDEPKLADEVKFAIRTHDVAEAETAIFNRAVISSQAFSRKFPDIDKQLKATMKAKGTTAEFAMPQRALNWLSRGLIERMQGHFLEAKDGKYSLDIAIYEYHLPLIAEWVKQAHDRGVKVRLVYHSKGDKTSKENKHLLKEFPMPNAIIVERKTKALMHDKFALISKDSANARKPSVLLCGSTNWTHNGCYRQANVVHISHNEKIMSAYAGLFEKLLATADDRASTKKWITSNNKIPAKVDVFAGFSPRSDKSDTAFFVKTIGAAKRDVLFATAFDLLPEILSALLGKKNDPILRLGIQNTKSKITGVHRDRAASFTTAALLPGGLEGWLKETTAKTKGNIRVHTKMFVTDFTSDEPVFVSGSHNFSQNASGSNDENYLVLRGDTDLADIYGCEIMRIYDHYRFRFKTKTQKDKNKASAPMLTDTSVWTDRYFITGSLHEIDRLRFVGK